MKWRCDTPPQKGYLSDTCAIPYQNKTNGCDTPLCDTISKGYCAIWGVSRTGPSAIKTLFLSAFLGGRFGCFYFFHVRGGGRGSPRRREGGGRSFIENPTRGGVSRTGREGLRGREGVCGELVFFGGGGGNFFFLAPKCPPSF